MTVDGADHPLVGRTIVVTRATDQASSLVEKLSALGAQVVAVPVIAVVDASDGGAALADAVARAASYDWILVTSANGADRLVVAAAGGGADEMAASGARFAAIGRGTAAALERHGIPVGLVPERFVAEGLLEVFPSPPPGGGRVLLAQAAGARPVLGDGLRAAGWTVDVAEAYRTVHPPVPTDRLAAAANADAITFTSASTVDGWLAAAGPDSLPPVVATIGPVTSAAAVAHGVAVDVEAPVHTIDGLVDAVAGYLAAGGERT
jgi:uroporphyrinogen-III synthase